MAEGSDLALYRLAVDLTVAAHFAFILFVIFGGLLAWRFPWLKWLHLPALAYGLLIEVFARYCPLTTLEIHLRQKSGLSLYEGGFISEYLNRIIYLNVSQATLVVGAVSVVAANLWVYWYAAQRRR